MTGSGVAVGPTGFGDTTVEIRSVNGRQLVVKQRLAPEVAVLDAAIERAVRARLLRGNVTVVVDVTAPAGAPAIDAQRFSAAAEALAELAREHGLGAVTVGDVLAVPGVVNAGARTPRVSVEPPADVVALLERALAVLCDARAREGRATVAAMHGHVAELDAAVERVTARAPQVVAAHRERLLERVNEFLAGRAHQLEPSDVVRELGLFADRVDVTEELVRLRAHTAQIRAVLGDGGEVGRRLEFLLQEVLREVNTIGSKSPDVEIAHTVVDMKSHLDRLREQAANLE